MTKAMTPHGTLSQPSELHPMMTAALISNKPEFVKLFLEHGVRLKELVTWDSLLYLYKNLDPSCLFHCKLQKVLAEEPERLACAPAAPRVQMHHVAQVLRELLGDSTQLLYPRPQTSDRPRLTLPVPHIKLNVRAGNVAPARLGLCAGSLLCPQSFLKNELLFLLEKKYAPCLRS